MIFSRRRLFQGFLLVYTVSSLCLGVMYLNFQLSKTPFRGSASPINQRACFYFLGVFIGCLLTCILFFIVYLRAERILPLTIGSTSFLLQMEIIFFHLINFFQIDETIDRQQTTFIVTLIVMIYFVLLQSFGIIVSWSFFRLDQLKETSSTDLSSV